MKHYDHQFDAFKYLCLGKLNLTRGDISSWIKLLNSKTMDETTFEWPEPTDEMLAALGRRRNTSDLQDMRDAIALDRQLLVTEARQIGRALSLQPPTTGIEWIITRGGTVKPLPEPTLEQALEAAKQLGGSQARIVTRYLEAQRKRQVT